MAQSTTPVFLDEPMDYLPSTFTTFAPSQDQHADANEYLLHSHDDGEKLRDGQDSTMAQLHSRDADPYEVARLDDMRHESRDVNVPDSPGVSERSSKSIREELNEVSPQSSRTIVQTLNALSDNTKYEPGPVEPHKPQMWNSLWLRTEVLISFAVLFIAMLLVTALLYHFSEANQGLSVQDSARHYAWTYGPTAFLTIVLSMWNQMDFAARILAPWKELKDGPTSVERSLMLDYIMPLVPVTLWNALKRRHWAVVSPLLGFFLLELTTVFSTGLLVLQPTTMRRDNVALSAMSEFDGSDFHLNRTDSNIGPNPTVLFYGTRLQGLGYPTGVSGDLAVPDFIPRDAGSIPPGANYSAIAPGVRVGLDCEYLPGLNGTRTHLPWWSILASFWVANITTPSCNLTNIIVAEGPDHNMYHQENATQAYEGYFGDYICDQSYDYSLPTTGLPNPANASAEHRIIMSMADLRFTPFDPMNNEPDLIYMNNLTVAVCKPYYTMGKYEVTYLDATGASMKAMTANFVSNTTSDIHGFASANLGAAVQYSVEKAYLGTGGQDWVLSVQVPSFYQILSAMNDNATIGVFMDAQRLIESGTEAFKGIATELIHEYMMKPANNSITGSFLFSENRLWVRALSVGFMCAFLAILSALSILMVFIRPVNVAPREPGSIAATATILTASPALHSLLGGLASAPWSTMRKTLSPFQFRSRVASDLDKNFCIEPIGITEQQLPPYAHEDHPASVRPFKWWTPMAITWWFSALAVVVPLLAVAALEVIQHNSDQYQGFVDVNPEGFAVTHGFATYVPAAVAFCVAGLFASMRLSVSILAPWMALKRGSATASQSVFLSLTAKVPPHRLFLALKSRNFGVALILIANFVAAWLPIIVSGLYVVTPVPDIQPISLQQSDVFDFKLNNLFYSDNMAGTNTGLILYSNLSYPRWTHDDLAFNALQATNSELSGSSPGVQMPFATHMMATRPSLNCTAVSATSRQAGRPYYESTDVPSGKVELQVNTTLPWACDRAVNVTTVPWQQYFLLPNDTTPAYFGTASVLRWSPSRVDGYGAVDTDFNHRLATSYAEDSVANWVGGYGCPSLAVTLGRGSVTPFHNSKNKTSYNYDTDIASIVCYQNFQTVNTSVTLSLPSMTFEKDHPPVPDESTARYLLNQLSGFSSHIFEFPINTLLLTLTSATENRTVPGIDGNDPDANYLDAFTTVLATQKQNVTIDSITGNANVPNLIDATRKLYSTYMTQAISFNMRSTSLDAKVSTPDSAEAAASFPTLHGLVSVPGRLRLVQQAGPKIALQAMLAFMVLCAIAGRLLLRGVDAVVPYNPCTIAGTAALLTDGEICTSKIIPLGSEWMSDDELRGRGVFEGWMFSLGWWQSGEDGSRWKYGVDIGYIVDYDGNGVAA